MIPLIVVPNRNNYVICPKCTTRLERWRKPDIPPRNIQKYHRGGLGSGRAYCHDCRQEYRLELEPSHA